MGISISGYLTDLDGVPIVGIQVRIEPRVVSARMRYCLGRTSSPKAVEMFSLQSIILQRAWGRESSAGLGPSMRVNKSP